MDECLCVYARYPVKHLVGGLTRIFACDGFIGSLNGTDGDPPELVMRVELYRAVGSGDTHIRILTSDDDLLARVGESEANLVLGRQEGFDERDAVYSEIRLPYHSRQNRPL